MFSGDGTVPHLNSGLPPIVLFERLPGWRGEESDVGCWYEYSSALYSLSSRHRCSAHCGRGRERVVRRRHKRYILIDGQTDGSGSGLLHLRLICSSLLLKALGDAFEEGGNDGTNACDDGRSDVHCSADGRIVRSEDGEDDDSAGRQKREDIGEDVDDGRSSKARITSVGQHEDVHVRAGDEGLNRSPIQ